MEAAADTLYTALWLRGYTKAGWVLHSSLNRTAKYYLPELDIQQRRKVIGVLIKRGNFVSYRPVRGTHPHYLFCPDPITDPADVQAAVKHWRWWQHWSRGWRTDWRVAPNTGSQ
jgi:hypothetical protein